MRFEASTPEKLRENQKLVEDELRAIQAELRA
jgi:hypothetical protein